MNEIGEIFDNYASEYDADRRRLIPCFDDFYGVALPFLSCKKQRPRVLDLGCGTGLFAAALLSKYPEAELTLADVSEQMLEQARKRFAGRENVTYIAGDYTECDLPENNDIVISALSIHHLSHREKRKLYARCYGLLANDGAFINADEVLSPSPRMERKYQEQWRAYAAGSGMDADSVQRAFVRASYDRCAPLADQLKWLKKAGFSYADCVYKYWHFAVLYAEKHRIDVKD